MKPKSAIWPGRTEEGAATVEFSLCVLVLVPTLLYALFFYEMSFARLKLQEASRYLVWEMTAFKLSDWKAEKPVQPKHDALFENARGKVLDEVVERWGDDLDGSTPRLVSNYKAFNPMTLSVTFNRSQASMQNTSPGVFTVANLDFFDEAANVVFGWVGFNEKGKAEGTLDLKLKNTLLAQTMPVWFTQKMLDGDDFTIRSRQSLIVDAWDLKDGKRVTEDRLTGTCANVGSASEYCRQVSKMTFAGLAEAVNELTGGFTAKAGELLGRIGVHSPLSTTVASLPLDHSRGLKSDHRLDVAKIPGHSPLYIHYTNTFKDTHEAASSTYHQVYQRLGPYYMGCPKELRQEFGSHKCDY
ncbi:MAG TPA: hypothetical protein DFS52_21785 [Myxococcales bacterium]|jgi:hypothetical protein|nr:hypothetical protein [Myxococcales bacterium]